MFRKRTEELRKCAVKQETETETDSIGHGGCMVIKEKCCNGRDLE